MHRSRFSEIFSLLFLLFVMTRCGSPPPTPMTYPFIEILLSDLPMATTQVQVDATFNNKTRSDVFSDNDMLGRITISLPPDGRGALDMHLTLRNQAGCILAMGTVSVPVAENEVISVPVTLNVLPSPQCPTGAMFPVVVNKIGDLFGDLTASKPGLDCLGTCTTKTAMFVDGTVLSVSATPMAQGAGQTINFDGWTGDCTGTGTCFITLTKATSVTAKFSCHGWCPENPATETNNLNGIWGFNAQRLVAVGSAATFLQYNGTSWVRVTAPVGIAATVGMNSVRGVAGAAIGFAVGDGGNIAITMDNGGQWTKSPNTQTKILRSVWPASATKAYAVGDEIGSNYVWQEFDGTAWNNPMLSSSGIAWNSVWGFGVGLYTVVGNNGRVATVNGAAYALPTSGSSNNLYGLWGTSMTSLIAVGASSTILTYNGTAFTTVTPPALGITLRGIHGASGSDVYVVGDGGKVLTYTNTWALDPFPVTTQLNGVFNFGGNNVYVVGNGGAIYHKRP